MTQLPADTPSMPIETMTKGLEVALAAALEHMEDVVLSVGTIH